MIQVTPISQETEYNCGPAVIQMLLSHFGERVSQDKVIEAAQIAEWIPDHGTQPQHMSLAVSKLAPELELLFKNKAELDDVEYFVHQKRLPVAVNWQGLFYDTPEEEPLYPSLDNGHYSLVIDINRKSDSITLLDPYPDFADQPRVFNLEWFTERWWDVATQVNPLTHKKTKLLTNQLLFVAKPKSEAIGVAMTRDLV